MKNPNNYLNNKDNPEGGGAGTVAVNDIPETAVESSFALSTADATPLVPADSDEAVPGEVADDIHPTGVELVDQQILTSDCVEYEDNDEVGDDEEPEAAAGVMNAVDYVLFFFEERKLQIRFDDSVVEEGKVLTAHTREMIDAVLAVQALNLSDIFDMMVIDSKERETGLKAGDIRSALRYVARQMKHARRNAVLQPYLAEFPAERVATAAIEWDRLDSLFDPIPDLRPALCIQHFIWQVKSKVLGRDINHHLMPVITSSIQGSGKTTFVKMLLQPLQELVTGASLLSDFSDRRTLGLFRYLVAVLDDMEAISENDVPVLKSIISGEDIHRRLLGSSMDAKVRQMTTPIGTSNSRIENLVPDDTGHRRFMTLLFRNGSVSKGGDPEIWQTVSSLDYDLLWRSVDPFAPSPLADHLGALAAYQSTARPPTGLMKWLIELDRNDPDIRRIGFKNVGVEAQKLHDLFETQTGTQLSKQAFAKEMFRCMSSPAVPFFDQHRYEKARVYRFRRFTEPAADATDDAPVAEAVTLPQSLNVNEVDSPQKPPFGVPTHGEPNGFEAQLSS